MRSPKLWHASVLLLGATGCAAVPAKPANGPVSAVEIAEDGKELNIPPTGVTDIDINSTVSLKVDRNLAQAALANAVGANSNELPRLTERIALVRSAATSQKAALEALRAGLESPPPAAEIREAIKQLGGLEGQALDDLEKVATRDEINEMLALGVGKSYQAAITRLDRENSSLQAELEAVYEPLQRVTWRMQAELTTATGKQALHLQGYDDLPPGEIRLINKLAIPKDLLSTADQARAAAKDIGDLETALQRARTVLAERATDLRDRLLVVAEKLEQLGTIAASIQTAGWQTVAQGKALHEAFRKTVDGATAILAPCNDAFGVVRRAEGASLANLVSIASTPGSPVQACLAALVEKGPALGKRASALIEQVHRFEQAIQTDRELAKVVREQALKDLQEVASRVQASAVVELEDWWGSVKSLFVQGRGVGSGPVFRTGTHLNDRGFSDLSDTQIDLVRSQRAPSDLVYYRASVVTANGEAQQWTSSPLRVVVTGWHVDVSASVVFVRAFHSEPQDSPFPAAPAATAALHYGWRRSSNENRGNPFWNFLDPGLGLHVAYLDLGPKVPAGSTTPPSDPSVELGVGATLQLFGDVLQGGIAYDLQGERPYAFFGIGLQTATNFGLTVPSNSHP